VEALTVELARYAGLDEAGVSVSRAERAFTDSEAMRVVIEDMTTLAGRCRAAKAEVKNLLGVVNVRVPSRSAIQEANRVWGEWAPLRDLRIRFADAFFQQNKLSGVASVPVMPDPEAARRTGIALSDARRLAGQQQIAVEAVKRLSGITSVVVPVIPVMGGIEAEIQELRNLLGRRCGTLKVLSGSEQFPKGLVSVSDRAAAAQKVATTMAWLREVRLRLNAAVAEISRLEKDMVEASRILTDVEAEIKGMLGNLGRCPVCRSPIVEAT